jgi:predicted nucleic acid-binding protein
MLVVDTSAFISLAVGSALDSVLEEYEIVTTQAVWSELEETAAYDDIHGQGAADVLSVQDQVTVMELTGEAFVTSRIDDGEASCVAAVAETEAAFLITDDYRALPELQELVDCEVALSPIVLRALVKRGVLTEVEATEAFDTIAEQRDWLGAPINRYARRLFE